MKKLGALIYGFISYTVGMASFVLLGLSLANVVIPNAIDAAPISPLGTALAINLGLIALFAIPHSVMARPGFKAVWTRLIPRPIERSTYVLYSGVTLSLLVFLWQPLGGEVWSVQNPTARAILYGVYILGWVTVVGSSFLINHFDLFGLRQVYLYARGREYTPLPFKTPLLYRIVRHPLYVGWLTVFWITPTMTLSHLFLAALIMGYILLAIRYEERDLVDTLGQPYADYRLRVPKLVPRLKTATRRRLRVRPA